jgi:hypothetical protein
MPANIHSEAAQLLDEPPDFGAVRRNFLRNLRAAHHYRGVLNEKVDDAPKS